MLHHAIIDEFVGVGAGGGVVTQGEKLGALRQGKGNGSGVTVIIPPALLGIVRQGNDGYGLIVEQKLAQGAGVAVALGGSGVAITDAQAVGARRQHGLLVI